MAAALAAASAPSLVRANANGQRLAPWADVHKKIEPFFRLNCRFYSRNSKRTIRLQHLRAKSSAPVAASVNDLKSPALSLQGLFFDCDGVLVDTERDGHRISFNETFKEKGLNVIWDVDLYGELLEIGGGKERMTFYFDKVGWPDAAPKEAAQRKDFVASLHKRKTDLFMELIEAGSLPLRPGVARLVDEALLKGVKVAVCSTSNEKAVSAIVRVLLGPKRAAFITIFAGDVVARKKPDPAIYTLAATSLSVDPARCVVIEDSAIGLKAAKAAGMKCIVTRSGYTSNENFEAADAIFDCIGDAPNININLDFCESIVGLSVKG